jgi:dUTPase
MVLSRVEILPFEECDSLDETGRNTGGFGHTGM